MAITPQYDAIVAKVRDWSAKRDAGTLPDSIIQSCLQYGMDDIYRTLRIPQLEYSVEYTVDAADNETSDLYTTLEIPEDLIEFIYLRSFDPSRPKDPGINYDHVTDVRTFMNPYAERYSRYNYTWKELKILAEPQLQVGMKVELHYYRRLAKLDALYSVSAINYDFAYSDIEQPLLLLLIAPDPGTDLYKVTSTGNPAYPDAIFDTLAESNAYVTAAGGGTQETVRFEGKEAWNWLRDAHEQIVLNAALKHVCVYMKDQSDSELYGKRMQDNIDLLNNEERFRRARGGNHCINVNTNGLI